MIINLRVLSDQGIDKFREYIHSLKDNPQTLRPDLNVEPYSCVFQPRVEIDGSRTFSTRMEMGEYLTQCFREAGIDRTAIIGNRELWTWLAYLWFDQLCPIINEMRGIRETARYICSSDYRDYYRHYVAASYDIYSLHGHENSRLFLYNPLHEHNDFTEQFASRQYIISNRNLIEVAHRLYWNLILNKPKRGAQSKKRLGHHLRLQKVFSQLELTYDIYSMTADEISNLLPEEFNEWKNPEIMHNNSDP